MDLKELKTVAVVGLGTMGRGIVQSFASIGYRVNAYDALENERALTLERVEQTQQTLVEAGLLDRASAAGALENIQVFAGMSECVSEVDLVVEAIPEDLDLKLAFYEEIDDICRSETIFASNTSGLSITRLASVTQRKDRVAGFHWWNPAHLVPLVEVIKGSDTSEETAQFLLSLAVKLGKRPVLVRRDVPGFVGNRLQFAVLREALHLVDEGIASAEDVDTAMKCGPGLRYSFLGPLETADLGGLDVFENISNYLFADLCSDRAPSGSLGDRVKKGQLGVKTGQGFYSYASKTLGTILCERDRKLIALLCALREGGTL